MEKIFRTIIILNILFITSTSLAGAQNGIKDHQLNDYDDYLNNAQAQLQLSDSDFTVLGRWTWGPAYAIEMAGNFALIGQGLNYQVFDVSDLSHPRLLYDTTLEAEVHHIKIIDTVLFVLVGRTILFCNARQLYPLREYGRYVDTWFVGFLDISVSDSLMFLTTDLGLVAVNISDLEHPVFRGGIGISIFQRHIPVASIGHYIYCGPQGPGFALTIFKWTPDSAFGQVWKMLDEIGITFSLLLRDTVLFVGTGKVFSFSIVDPWNPRLLDSIFLGPIIIGDMSSKGDNLYCATEDSGIIVLNIADPSHLSIVGHAPRKNNLIVQGSAASDTVLGVAEHVGVDFYSVAQTDSIERITFLPTGGYSIGIAKRGNIVFVASQGAGLWSVDFSDTQHPRALSNTETPDIAHDVILTNNIACVLAKRDGYMLYDSVVIVGFDNLGSLTRLSSFATDVNATSMAVRDTLVVVGADSAVGIFSIADPLHPYRLSTWKQPGINLSVSIDSNILAVGARAWDAGLRLLDISDPWSPKQLSYVPMDVIGVLLQDSFAFVGQPHLEILNISNPSSPSVIVSSDIPCGSSVKFCRSGTTLYKTGDYVGVVDISRLDQPYEVASLLYWSWPYGLVASNDTLLVATSRIGVWALKNNLVNSVREIIPNIPTGFALFENYPNPFNSSTVIHYQLPIRSLVIVKVFNVLGQEVETLISETNSAGRYELKWDASDVPSGVYYYRLKTGEFEQTKKMMLLR